MVSILANRIAYSRDIQRRETPDLMFRAKTAPSLTRQPGVANAVPLIRRLKELRPVRRVADFFDWGLTAPGFNLTWQTEPARVLELIRKLRPLDCGKELIRVGGAGDGGYLIPNDLDGIEYCFSPGVNTTSDFEDQLAELGIKSFLADYSVDAPPIDRPEFIFDKKFVGVLDDEKVFTLSSWKEKYLENYAGDLILQMDIEGAEYSVILSTPPELLSQFRILVIEIHYLDRLFDPCCFDLLDSCLEKLLESFCVVHIHPNNFYGSAKRGVVEIPRLMEFTFLNKKRISHATPVRTFPHPLDALNVPFRRSLDLPKCWYADM
jgi:hypothetical protein